MAQDHNDIYTIVERLAILEGRITPTTVKKGLNPQQKSVPQLPALFKPKHISVLGGKKDPKHPMAGYAVGAGESEEKDESILESDMAEDVLEKVKKSFKDFIKSAEEKLDTDLKDKKQEDTDLKNKEKTDRGLKAKDHPVTTDPDDDQQDLPSDLAYQRGESPYDQPDPQVESAAVKTVNNEYGLWEMHGNERDGFEVRRSGRSLPTRFETLDEAEMAVEMFAHRRKMTDESQDYLDEE